MSNKRPHDITYCDFTGWFVVYDAEGHVLLSANITPGMGQQGAWDVFLLIQNQFDAGAASKEDDDNE